MIDPREKLCYHDPRNPFFTPDDQPREPRNGCACDNCFYGRDQMALEIIRLSESLEAERKAASKDRQRLESIRSLTTTKHETLANFVSRVRSCLYLDSF